MIRAIYIVLFSVLLTTLTWADGNRYAENSVLSSGKWIKIRVAETGIYKLTHTELRNLGFSDPTKVAVHGYGGWPLEEDFSKTYIDDLPATSIYRGSDYILFYAKGPVKWEYSSGRFIHTNNPYSSYGYYFLTDATTPVEMEKLSPESGTAVLNVDTYDDYMVHEKDEVSLNKSGRELYGESFYSSNSRPFSFSIPGITQDAGRITLRFVGRPTGSTKLSIDLNNTQSWDTTVTLTVRNPLAASYVVGNAYSIDRSWTGEKSENIKATVAYGLSNDANAYLDYIRLQMVRTLQLYGAYTFFRSIRSQLNISRFNIQNANSNTTVFEVTEDILPREMGTTLEGSVLSFTNSTFSSLGPREFVIVQKDRTFPTPEIIGEVDNQDLHSLPQTDMVIITPSAFLSQAERLAETHRTMDELQVTVVNHEHIFNEFSSGTPDATAYRRFMKMFYDRSTSEKDAPKYLLLFGGGSFDNRFLTNDWKNTGLENRVLLTFQTKESLTYESYPVEDYFGILGDNTGSGLSTDKIDVGVGRLPIRTLAEATNLVDKIISYMQNQEIGNWKNQITLLADDGSSSDSFDLSHIRHAEAVAEALEKNQPEYQIKKLYFDAYKKDFSGGNGSYPDVRQAFDKAIKEGSFIVNYSGHGSTKSLSDEEVVTQSDISGYSYSNLPFWIVATCDFARLDGVTASAGEDVLLNKTSGGIGIFTSTRVGFAGPNREINVKLIEALFPKDGNYPRLGDALKEAKNRYSSTALYKFGYALLGDPALRLNYPQYNMRITAINGESLNGDTVWFKAMEKITIEGEVLDLSGNVASGFSGWVYPTVMDSQDSITTLDNNNLDRQFTYTDYPTIIYQGNDVVKEGKFSLTFTVPKEIRYSNKEGKISLYAYDEATGIEANGYFTEYKVGGTAEDAEEDKEGPEIRALYLNDSTFVEGGKVNTTPLFVARLWDKNGINITGSSIGHDITLTIDNQPLRNYTLNNYYEIIPETNGEGMIKFPVPALESGVHTAEFKVWDVMNNSTTHTFEFEVEEGLKPDLSEVIATPVPAREKITFYIYHNRPESNLRVSLMVYDMTGKLQWKHEESGYSDYSKPYTVTWDLTNNSGSRLRSGIYLYRAAISTDNSKEATTAKKLIILGQ